MTVFVSSTSIARGFIWLTAATRFFGVFIFLHHFPLLIAIKGSLLPYIVNRRYKNNNRRGSCNISSNIS